MNNAPTRHGDFTRARIFAAIETFTADRGYGPGIRDLQAMCGLSSTSVVVYHLRALERAGRIVRDPSVARTIRIVR